MGLYIMFNEPQKRNKGGQYEAFVKYRISNTDQQYYYIGEDNFDKARDNYIIGDIISERGYRNI